MNWHQKDVTNINSNLQAQELYTTEKQFPGLASDVHLRLKYQAGIDTLIPIMALKENLDNIENTEIVKEHLEDALKLGASNLSRINQE